MASWRISARGKTAALATTGILFIGFVDYLTGVEIRVFPLYFIPLVYASRTLGRRWALVLAVGAAVVWLASMYLGGHVYSHAYVWAVNFVTQGAAFVVVVQLVSSLNEAIARERAQGRVDTLTGLANRRSFDERAEALLALCRRDRLPVTIAILDLDNFKGVNDHHGHAQGDRLLHAVGEFCRETLRASDIAARLGGDEFAFLLPDTPAEGAERVLGKLHRRIAAEPPFSRFHVTASIGAVAYDQAPPDLASVLGVADRLMYDVKRECKNALRVATA